MKIDGNLEKRIHGLSERYDLFSQEEELISNVSRWVYVAARSLVPGEYLKIAEDHINIYEETGANDSSLVKELRGIVGDAKSIYGEMEVARN